MSFDPDVVFILFHERMGLSVPLSRKLVGMALDYIDRYGVDEFRREYPPNEEGASNFVRDAVNVLMGTRYAHLVEDDPLYKELYPHGRRIRRREPKGTQVAPKMSKAQRDHKSEADRILREHKERQQMGEEDVLSWEVGRVEKLKKDLKVLYQRLKDMEREERYFRIIESNWNVLEKKKKKGDARAATDLEHYRQHWPDFSRRLDELLSAIEGIEDELEGWKVAHKK